VSEGACTSGKRIGLAILRVDRPSSPMGAGPFLFYVFEFVGEGRIRKEKRVLHAERPSFIELERAG
jgi:hypothetical protein